MFQAVNNYLWIAIGRIHSNLTNMKKVSGGE
jgi:hypothetical protein